MDCFSDANLYQSHPYDWVRYGKSGVTHMVLRKDDAVLAAVQVRIVQLPVVKKGIAYILWGPMWRKKNRPENVEVFEQTLRALRHELSFRRGLLLRLHPLAFKDTNNDLLKILIDEGFTYYDDGKSHRTLIIGIDPSLKEIRASLDQKWRNCLNRSEKNNLEIIEGTEKRLFDEISAIYLEMADRKGLFELSDIEHLKKVQKELPSEQKLRVILCRQNGETHAGAIFSAMGDRGVYLVGATSDNGMKSKGSYLIQWAFIKWLKENGFKYYDLNGINPELNPGTYHFKKGIAGKQGIDVEFLGKYQVADNPLSALIVSGGESLVSTYKKLKRRLVKGKS